MRTSLVGLGVAVLLIACGAASGFGAARAANLDEACGGPSSITCNSALWCQKAAGQCGVAEATGQCDKSPSFCMRVSRPVCGCNGKTYSNDCERQHARAQLDHVGACKKEAAPGEETPAAAKRRKKSS